MSALVIRGEPVQTLKLIYQVLTNNILDHIRIEIDVCGQLITVIINSEKVLKLIFDELCGRIHITELTTVK